MLQNGRGITPSHVPVWLVEAGPAEIHLRDIKAQLERARRKFDEEAARLNGEFRALREQRSSIAYEGVRLAEAVMRAEKDGNQAALVKARAELDKCDEERSRVANQELAIGNALDELAAQRDGLACRLFLENWPAVVARTASDARGEFVFRVSPRRKVVVVAAYSDKIEERTETFQWFVPVNKGNAASILFGNSNLLGNAMTGPSLPRQ